MMASHMLMLIIFGTHCRATGTLSIFLPLVNTAVVMHLVTSVCLSVCPALALTFDNLDPQTSFSVHSDIFRISMSSCMSRSSGQSQGHRSKSGIYERNQIHVFVGGPPSIESQPHCQRT